MTEIKNILIEVPKQVKESLVELRKVVIINGLKSFPADFMDYLEKKKIEINDLSYGEMIKLCVFALSYLFDKNENLNSLKT